MHRSIPIERVPSTQRSTVSVIGALLAVTILVNLMLPVFANLRLDDFANTFYPAANYLLRGENAYVNAYPHPTNGRQYPPYAPVWMLASMVPLSVFPLPVAESLRFLLDLALLPFLAYLCIRLARLRNVAFAVILVIAPWHLTELSTGQWTVILFVGVLLCYWAAQRANPAMMAVGLWLALAKPNIVALIILASLIFAWRAKILSRTLAILGTLVLLSSLVQPGWIGDLLSLYVDRLVHSRPADSILLLPGYPYAQLTLLALGAVGLGAYIWRTHRIRPTPWLWAVLLTVSLVGALHTFIYDWQLLMLPLALLLRERWGLAFTLGLYLFAVTWAVVALGLQFAFPSPTLIPPYILLAICASRMWPQLRARALWSKRY